MSTPVIVAAIVGAFILGLLLGVPLAIAVSKRRLKAVASAEPSASSVDISAVPELTAEAPVRPKPATHKAEYVITSAGETDSPAEPGARMEFKPRPQFEQVARTAMIEAASLAHGLRNALSEENRAKISYEIKRELIRVRKDRKIEVKEALREYRARHRAAVDPAHAVPSTGEEA